MCICVRYVHKHTVVYEYLILCSHVYASTIHAHAHTPTHTYTHTYSAYRKPILQITRKKKRIRSPLALKWDQRLEEGRVRERRGLNEDPIDIAEEAFKD